MSFPGLHSKVTFFGDAFASEEIWQTGLRLTGITPPTTQQLVDLAAAFVNNIWGIAFDVPARNRFLGVKWAPQNEEGDYGDTGESVEYFLPTADAGTAANGYPQIALVLSLRTSRPRGLASNGRMYIPSAMPIDTDGLISTSDATGAATAGAAFIGAVNDVGLGDVVVMSSVGTGLAEAVTSVRVGRVMDTQRRRRNALPELYTVPVEVPS